MKVVHEIISIDSENNLVDRFGKPTLSVYNDFMTASSFLAYGSNCLTVREVGTHCKKRCCIWYCGSHQKRG